MDDNEKIDDENVTIDLEEVASPIEEVSILSEPVNLNEELCDKLLDFLPTKISFSRAGVKSSFLEQMVLLGKMDPRRLKENPKHNHDCCTH